MSRRALGLLVLVIVCALGYGNVLDAGFVYDDLVNITQRASLRWTELSLANWWNAVIDSPSKRPVALASFGLQYWSGLDSARHFRALNLFIHLANALMVWRLTVLLMERAPGGGALGRETRELAGWVVALIFVSHPLQTQSVTYIVQRMNLLAATGQLACLLLYMSGRRQRDPVRRVALFALAAGAWGLGLGSKESAAIAPVVIWLYEWYFEQDLDEAFVRRTAVVFALIGVPTLGAAAVLVAMSGYDPMASYPVKDFTPLERLISEPRVLLFYASQIVWPAPSRLSLLHSFEVSRTLLHPWTTLPSIFIVLGALAGCAFSARRHRLASFCGLWFFLELAIESTVVPLALAMEHRLYLPLLGPVIALADFVARRWPARLPERRVWTVLVGVSIGLLVAATHVRNRVWVAPEWLWADVLEKYPDDFVARMNLGFHLAGVGRHAEALGEYQRALRLAPDDSRLHTNIGSSLLSLGRNAEGIEALQHAIELDPDNPLAPPALGRALAIAGRRGEAIDLLLDVVRRRGDPQSWLLLGQLQQLDGRLGAARRSLEIASRTAPGWGAPQEALGVVAIALSEVDRAIGHFERALRLEPTASAHMHAGLAYWPDRDPTRAIAHLESAHRIAPDWLVVTNNLAWMLATAPDPALRDGPRALVLAREADRVVRGGDPEILSTLAAALAETGSLEAAVSTIDRALRLARNQGELALEAEFLERRARYVAGYGRGEVYVDPSSSGGVR